MEDCLSRSIVKKFIHCIGIVTVGRDWSTVEKYLAQSLTASGLRPTGPTEEQAFWGAGATGGVKVWTKPKWIFSKPPICFCGFGAKSSKSTRSSTCTSSTWNCGIPCRWGKSGTLTSRSSMSGGMTSSSSEASVRLSMAKTCSWMGGTGGSSTLLTAWITSLIAACWTSGAWFCWQDW